MAVMITILSASATCGSVWIVVSRLCACGGSNSASLLGDACGGSPGTAALGFRRRGRPHRRRFCGPGSSGGIATRFAGLVDLVEEYVLRSDRNVNVVDGHAVVLLPKLAEALPRTPRADVIPIISAEAPIQNAILRSFEAPFCESSSVGSLEVHALDVAQPFALMPSFAGRIAWRACECDLRRSTQRGLRQAAEQGTARKRTGAYKYPRSSIGQCGKGTVAAAPPNGLFWPECPYDRGSRNRAR